jgi:hypothetical protein
VLCPLDLRSRSLGELLRTRAMADTAAHLLDSSSGRSCPAFRFAILELDIDNE